MSKEPRLFDSSQLEDWYVYNQDLLRAQGIQLLTESPECREFLWTFRPYTNDYTSSLNPVFLAQIPNLEVLAKRSVWLVRDGLVPLLWFFRNYPDPGQLKSKLLVQQELIPAIPKSWLGNIGSFRTVSRATNALTLKKKPKKTVFVITGLVSESICSLERLNEI